MFDHTHYVPVLRWKRAEWIALRELRQTTSKMTPLIEIVPTSFEPRKNRKPTPNEVFGKISEDIFENWGQELIFVDLWHLSDLIKSTKMQPFQILNNNAQNHFLSLIPVTGFDRIPEYQTSVKSMVTQNGDGVCIRIVSNNLVKNSFSKNLWDLLDFLESPPENVDLIIDFQLLTSISQEYQNCYAQIPKLNSWRTVTFIGGAFPVDLSDLEVGDHKLPRYEWLSWGNLVKSITYSRKPTFGDYTIQHPIYARPPKFANFSASIRYTCEKDWFVLRGESARKVGYDQWPAQAQLLYETEEYCGPDFSYGDSYIKERSLELLKPEGIEKTGGAETWLRAGVNHHLQFSMWQIADCFVPLTSSLP